jgi:hypothetical protein
MCDGVRDLFSTQSSFTGGMHMPSPLCDAIDLGIMETTGLAFWITRDQLRVALGSPRRKVGPHRLCLWVGVHCTLSGKPCANPPAAAFAGIVLQYWCCLMLSSAGQTSCSLISSSKGYLAAAEQWYRAAAATAAAAAVAATAP